VILGIGTDLCEVDRMAAALARSGDRFAARVFTHEERDAAAAQPEPAAFLARCFALKEACFKSLGRGWPDDIGFDEIRMTDPSARCGLLVLSGRAATWAARAGVRRVHAATTCDGALAAAVVIAEGLSPSEG
jgi:holo-[acyl-carrier protein] synthase